jgi:hypothetical protein
MELCNQSPHKSHTTQISQGTSAISDSFLDWHSWGSAPCFWWVRGRDAEMFSVYRIAHHKVPSDPSHPWCRWEVLHQSAFKAPTDFAFSVVSGHRYPARLPPWTHSFLPSFSQNTCTQEPADACPVLQKCSNRATSQRTPQSRREGSGNSTHRICDLVSSSLT